ncbi:putative RNA-directed DNA polymerase from transposon X-element [Araneus ventricosus]|uniref:Putative RNA-directed DNA polymerase from transposon X-element n=1 Tax=Araneus ventricosus TaxID=182803 RepID=A0A4Y2MRS6_ARAVE|nr:putative RNA-directed DNA polymerase from transposon X-element [Araneus ventricosus]GBN29070.1 putative RNA-directed DNA polymerase from transposon X-element [Araneus ventricosus]
MLKHLGESSLLTILLLFNRIWQERVFPLSWLKAIVVPIPKPGKDKQYPNNYRPIALTSCLSKLLERMVSARLMHALERSKWFVPSQSGFRRRRNTIDNLLKLETAIREAFVRKKHLVSIFFDIEKAYDRTWRYGILKDLSDIGLKGNLPLFIKNFLQTRIFQIRIGNILSDNFNQQEGVPQGSVLSVLLFIIKINGIVSKLPPYVNSTLFVDGIQIHCAGDDMGFIQRQLQTAINNMTDWSSKNGFIFSPQKTVCMHFCRRRGLHPDPDFQLNGSPIPIVQETKFLGIIFDTKLTFRSHIKHLKTKCIRTLNIMKVLSSTSWGADKVSLMRIYRSLVRSKLDYGVPVYGSAAKSTLKMLDSVHHQGLRIATGAFRTTPIPSLHVISGEPSLELRRHRLSLSYFYKIKSDESHPQHYKVINPIFGSLFSVRLSFTPTFGFRIGEILRQHYSDYIPIYTDGSKSDNHVGSAAVFPDFTIAETLHHFCSVYTSELYAIYLGLLKISTLNFKKAIIYTDYRSGINALRSAKHNNHPLVMKCFDLHHILKNTKIKYCWIPGHVGIPGNERADKAAKSANASREAFVPLIDALQVVKLSQHRVWQRIWDRQSNNKLYKIQPSIKGFGNLTIRKHDVILTRLRVGHTFLTHRHLLHSDPAPICNGCNCILSVEHILCQCKNFYSQRQAHFGAHIIDLIDILGTNPGVNVFTFLKEVQFFKFI